MYSLRVDLIYKGSISQYIDIEDVGPERKADDPYSQMYQVKLSYPEEDYPDRIEFFQCHFAASDLSILTKALKVLDEK